MLNKSLGNVYCIQRAEDAGGMCYEMEGTQHPMTFCTLCQESTQTTTELYNAPFMPLTEDLNPPTSRCKEMYKIQICQNIYKNKQTTSWESINNQCTTTFIQEPCIKYLTKKNIKICFDPTVK